MSGCPFHRPTTSSISTNSGGEGDPPLPLEHTSSISIASPTPTPVPAGLSEDDLECPVCLRLLHLPSSLPCGHTFCGPCLGRTSERAGGTTIRCPVCRAETDADPAPRPNALLSALIEKHLPEAASRRRAEAATDDAEERARFVTNRRVKISTSVDQFESDVAITVQMDGVSRCPMSTGTRVPINFYVARVEAHLPPEMFDPPLLVSESGPGDPWVLRVRRSRGLEQAMTNNGEDVAARVVLHFQPRFQIPPALVPIRLQPPGVEIFLVVEFDGRLVHH